MSEKSLVEKPIIKKSKKSRTSVGVGTGDYDASRREIEKEAKRLATMSQDKLIGDLTIQPKMPDFVASATGKKHSYNEKVYAYRLKAFTNLRRKVWSMMKEDSNDVGWHTNPVLLDFFKKKGLLDAWKGYAPTFNKAKVKYMLLDDKRYNSVMAKLNNFISQSKDIKENYFAEELKKENLILRRSKVDFVKDELLDLIKVLRVGDVFRNPIKVIYDENGIKDYTVSNAVLLDDKKYDKLMWSFYVMKNRVKEIAKQRRWFGR